MKTLVFLIIILLCIAMPLFADCEKPETSFESKACMYEEFVRLEKQVNISYRDALKSISDQSENKQNKQLAKQKMISAQKSWRIFRDKDCAVYGAINLGENNSGQIELQCLIDRINQRIIELNKFNHK